METSSVHALETKFLMIVEFVAALETKSLMESSPLNALVQEINHLIKMETVAVLVTSFLTAMEFVAA